MTITNMTAAHIAQIAALEKLCFSDPWSEKSIGSELENDLALWLVALDGEKVVGYAGTQTVMGETDMMNIAVHPDCRRKGFAAMLVECLVRELKNRGSHSLTLEVRTSNAPAKAMYEKLGFIQVGCRKNYYRNPKEDALILRKEWDI